MLFIWMEEQREGELCEERLEFSLIKVGFGRKSKQRNLGTFGLNVCLGCEKKEETHPPHICTLSPRPEAGMF